MFSTTYVTKFNLLLNIYIKIFNFAGRLSGNVVLSGNVLLNGKIKKSLHYGIVVSVLLFLRRNYFMFVLCRWNFIDSSEWGRKIL